MTNFDKVKGYYRVFDEKNRLVNSGSGKLEYMMSMDLLKHWLPENGKILDLGGGAGAYSFPLAAEGYKVTLADLSEELIRQAEEQNEQTDYPVTCNVVNAVDLSQYHDREFDAVLLMGPLYHLLEKSERDQCIAEVNRVLKPGGIVFATFLPYLTGSIGVVDRFFGHPEQVNAETIRRYSGPDGSIIWRMPDSRKGIIRPQKRLRNCSDPTGLTNSRSGPSADSAGSGKRCFSAYRRKFRKYSTS